MAVLPSRHTRTGGRNHRATALRKGYVLFEATGIFRGRVATMRLRVETAQGRQSVGDGQFILGTLLMMTLLTLLTFSY